MIRCLRGGDQSSILAKSSNSVLSWQVTSSPSCSFFVNTDTQGGVVTTQVFTVDGSHPHKTETIRHTVMPTEIITKEIIIQGDGQQLTAEELKDIIAKHGTVSQDVVTTVSSVLATAPRDISDQSHVKSHSVTGQRISDHHVAIAFTWC